MGASPILVDLTRLVAPVLSFTAEEIWGYIAKDSGNAAESVFLVGYPVADESLIDAGLEARWEKLIALRNEANKALEIRKQEKFVGSGLEVKLVLHFLTSMQRCSRLYRVSACIVYCFGGG